MPNTPDLSLTRRGLLLAAAAGALGKAAPGPRKIRVAVFGIGHAHAMGKVTALRTMDEFEFAGACEPDKNQRRTAKALQGVRWLSQEEMLQDPSIELIAVESRVQENLEYARLCVEAGKHVHLDKAPGESLSGLRSLLGEAGRRKLAVQMGYQWRYHPAMQAAIEAARKGWLGEVYMLRATINKPISPEERVQLAAFRGGMMFELGCHMIDRMVDLLGRPKRVTTFLRHDTSLPDKLADNTLAIFEYDQAMAEIYIAAQQPNGGQYRTFEILGTNGTATVRPFSPYRMSTDLKEEAGPHKPGAREIGFPPPPGPAYAPDFRELARVIRQGERPSYSPEHDLITHQALLEACGVA